MKEEKNKRKAAASLSTSRTPLYHADSPKFYWNHCWYCGKEIYMAKTRLEITSKHNHFTRDHVVPESQGGGRGVNTVPACYACNRRKKAHSLEAFRMIVFGKKGGLFFGEAREEELKKQRGLPLALQLMKLTVPDKPVFKPRPVRCMVRRELIYHTFVTRLLRVFFR